MRTGSLSRWMEKSGLITALGALLAAGPAAADVYLHPGKLAGPVELSGWTFTNSDVSLQGNANGFQAYVHWGSAESFELTTEGDQTYEYLHLRRFFAGGYFTLTSRAPLHVPVNDTLAVDLRRPGGTVISKFNVVAGSLVSSRNDALASALLQQEEYFTTVDSNASVEVSIPVVAGVTHSIHSSAVISLVDGQGRGPCKVQVSLPTQHVSVAEGAVAVVTHNVVAPEVDCSTGSVVGTVALSQEPRGISFSRAQIWTDGKMATVKDGASSYLMEGLKAGWHPMTAQLYFEPAPGSTGAPRGMLQLPDTKPYVDIVAGSETRKDFLAGGAAVGGTFMTKNVLEHRFRSDGAYLLGVHDPSLPDGGPTRGGYAFFYPSSSNDRTFNAIVTPGEWSSPIAYFSYSDGARDPQYYFLSHTSYASGSVQASAGGSISIPTVSVENSSAVVYFDVVEAPGAPQVLLSHPILYGSRYHSQDDDSAYVEVRKTVSNRARVGLVFAGPRGKYDLSAFAYIGSSWTQFSSSVLQIGTAVATSPGSNIAVSPQGSAGEALPVSLQFNQVTGEGQTTAGVSDIGPAPAEGYELLEIAAGGKYLSLTSTATFSGDVEVAVTYDPVALGLTPEQESLLVLQQFFCAAEDEDCEWVTLGGPGMTGELSASADGSSLLSGVQRVIRGRAPTLGVVVLAIAPAPTCPQGVTGPTLVLRGRGQTTLECGVDTWVDPGADAWDVGCTSLAVHRYNSGGDASGPGPNASAEGTYSVEYLAWNPAGTTVSAIRSVQVDDRKPPTLKLLGQAHMTHSCGSPWDDPGVEASDACYGDVAPMVRKTGSVNGWVAGSYTVVYDVTDSGGNSAPPVTRTVDVVNCPW